VRLALCAQSHFETFAMGLLEARLGDNGPAVVVLHLVRLCRPPVVDLEELGQVGVRGGAVPKKLHGMENR